MTRIGFCRREFRSRGGEQMRFDIEEVVVPTVCGIIGSFITLVIAKMIGIL